MRRKWRFVIACVAAVAMMLGLQACEDKRGQFPRQEIEMQVALTRATKAFRATWSEPPLPLRWDTLSPWLADRLRAGCLDEIFDDHELNPEELEQDEILVLLLSGIYVGGERGEEGWLRLGDLVERGPFTYFLPNPRFIQDADGDGWTEYSVPGRPGFTYFWHKSGAISMARRHEWADP